MRKAPDRSVFPREFRPGRSLLRLACPRSRARSRESPRPFSTRFVDSLYGSSRTARKPSNRRRVPSSQLTSRAHSESRMIHPPHSSFPRRRCRRPTPMETRIGRGCAPAKAFPVSSVTRPEILAGSGSSTSSTSTSSVESYGPSRSAPGNAPGRTRMDTSVRACRA